MSFINPGYATPVPSSRSVHYRSMMKIPWTDYTSTRAVRSLVLVDDKHEVLGFMDMDIFMGVDHMELYSDRFIEYPYLSIDELMRFRADLFEVRSCQ